MVQAIWIINQIHSLAVRGGVCIFGIVKEGLEEWVCLSDDWNINMLRWKSWFFAMWTGQIFGCSCVLCGILMMGAN